MIPQRTDLTGYISTAIARLIGSVATTALANPREAGFLLKAQKNIRIAAKTRLQYEQEGRHIPAFLIASIADTCNLACSGCYARANGLCGPTAGGKPRLDNEAWQNVFHQAAKLGVSFVLLAGGEPMMEREIIQSAAAVSEVIFPIFTNGTLLDEEYLDLFHRHRNLVPVLSIEGDQYTTEARRGEGVYNTLFAGMQKMKMKGMLFGASITVTTQNLTMVTNPAFLQGLRDAGCRLVFFVEYVPVDAGTEHLAFDVDARQAMEQQVADARKALPEMVFLSFPGDEEQLGGCLAAGRGFFHISPYGDAEPCPFSPYSRHNLHQNTLLEVIDSPFFSEVQKIEQMHGGQHAGGCLLYKHRDEVEKLAANK